MLFRRPKREHSKEKELNFIWVGGNELPVTYFNELELLLKLNTNYQVVLWTDNADLGKAMPQQHGEDFGGFLEGDPLNNQLASLVQGTNRQRALQVRSVDTLKWSSNPKHHDAVGAICQALRQESLWAAMTDCMRVAIIAREESVDRVRVYSELDGRHPEKLADFSGGWAHGIHVESGYIYSQVLAAEGRTKDGRRMAEGIRDSIASILFDNKDEFLALVGELIAVNDRERKELYVIQTFGRLVDAGIMKFFRENPKLDKAKKVYVEGGANLLGIEINFGRSWLSPGDRSFADDAMNSSEAEALVCRLAEKMKMIAGRSKPEPRAGLGSQV